MMQYTVKGDATVINFVRSDINIKLNAYGVVMFIKLNAVIEDEERVEAGVTVVG